LICNIAKIQQERGPLELDDELLCYFRPPENVNQGIFAIALLKRK
jgi:hypothetical protein